MGSVKDEVPFFGGLIEAIKKTFRFVFGGVVVGCSLYVSVPKMLLAGVGILIK